LGFNTDGVAGARLEAAIGRRCLPLRVAALNRKESR
jgi:hypothetical protein